MPKTAVVTALCLVLLAGAAFILTREEQPYRRTLVDFDVPQVTLRNQLDEPVNLRDFLRPELPLLLEFTFTSCTTFCPGQAVLFTNLQKRLPDSRQVRLVSITVDPDIDTPAVLRAYLTQYQARPGWDFLTGSRADIQRVMAAFNYRPTDMVSLDSAMLLRSARSGQWIRIDGQLDGESLLHEYRLLDPDSARPPPSVAK